MIKRVIYLVTTGVLLATVITGCGKDPISKLSKSELVARVNQDIADIQEKDTRVEELETLLKGVQEEDGPTSSISSIEDGTGRLTFNSINNKIIFPVDLAYPNSTQAANTSCINITDTISISPTNNWTVVMDGATAEFNHTNGVTGIIRAGAITEMVEGDVLQETVMSPFFAEFPPEKITYSKIFLDDNCWGIDGKTATSVNSNPAYIRCGVFGFGETCFTYMFLYEGDNDPGKDETILSMLKTMTVFQQPIRIA